MAQAVRCQNSSNWRTIVFRLDDAHFNRCLERDSDLTIKHLDGEGALFHMLELRRRSFEK
jgi:hypothetical protein